MRMRTKPLRMLGILFSLALSLPAGAEGGAAAPSSGADAVNRATFSAPAGTPQSRTEESPAGAEEVRVGVLAYSPPWYDGAFVDESIRYLAWRLPEYRFSVHFLSAESLEKSVAAKNVDLVVAPAAFLAFSAPNSLHELASIVSDAAPDSSRSLGAAVIVRRDREDLKTLKDLRGKRVAAVVDEPSPGILEVKREVARLNADPDVFFGSIQTVPRLRMKEVLSHVLSGRADAGILRGCFLEDLWKAGNRTFEAEIRVLDAKRGDGLACRHSTALYPGWTVAASERLSQDAARAVEAVLLTKPANAWGQYWTVSTNTSSYTDLMKTLRIGAYAYLREWTLSRVWDEYRPFILVAIVALLGLLAHSAILEKLVRRRTEELERVHAGQQAAERHAREMTERLDQLQRAGAVGQISSIVAHEMKQPLAVIQNLSRGTIRMIEDEPETLDEVSKAVESINDEAGRAAAIIDRVRTYSQGRSERRAVEFSDALHDAVTQFHATRRGRLARIVFGRIDRGEVWIDPLDLELIIINLLANAVDAAKNVEDPRVFVELLRIPGSPASEAALELHVSDNGPRISDDAFDSLGKRLLKSTKPGGLGLGLSIVRTLAENCVGRLSFERSAGDGITAVVVLPVMHSKEAKRS